MKLEEKLAKLAELAEEISAELYERPDTARKFLKVAAYSRKIATCLRVHGQVPLESGGSPVMQAAKSVDQLVRNFAQIGRTVEEVRKRYE